MTNNWTPKLFESAVQNSDQSKFKLTLTNQNLKSLSMWRVYNFKSDNHVYILSCKHATRPIGARVLS